MNKKKGIATGDIVLIPLGSDIYNVSKVIYLSSHFKNGMALGVYNIFIRDDSNISELNMEYSAVLYTSTEGITDNHWRIVDNSPVTNSDLILTKRIVAGDVWQGDEKIGKATPDDYKNLPKQLALGIKLVEKKIVELYNNSDAN